MSISDDHGIELPFPCEEELVGVDGGIESSAAHRQKPVVVNRLSKLDPHSGSLAANQRLGIDLDLDLDDRAMKWMRRGEIYGGRKKIASRSRMRWIRGSKVLSCS